MVFPTHTRAASLSAPFASTSGFHRGRVKRRGAVEVPGPETRSRHGHTEARDSPLPNATSKPCMIFIHCAKEQPSTARNGGTSMVVGRAGAEGGREESGRNPNTDVGALASRANLVGRSAEQAEGTVLPQKSRGAAVVGPGSGAEEQRRRAELN